MRDLVDKTVRECVVSEQFEGQRLDNYLLREWRGVPRSLIYRLIRNGHIRVNVGRVRPDCRLSTGDRLRLPASVRVPEAPPPTHARPLALQVLYEDEILLAVDKPAGLAVHGGSGVAHGVIERLRAHLPQHAFLELVHRLDRDTSGVLLLAKKRSALTAIQQQWRAQKVEKKYTALVLGVWQAEQHREIKLPLKRIVAANGNRHVIVDSAGKNAYTRTRLLQQYSNSALLEADLQTGRTHQLRVHFATQQLPILGDERYGDFALNHSAARAGWQRMFLHAQQLAFTHPQSAERVQILSPLAEEFTLAAQWLAQQRTR